MTVSDLSLRSRGRWHTTAGAVIAFWLLVGVALTVGYQFGVGVTWWDVIHPFTIGALTTAILVYSTHFAEALTRTATADYRGVALRVAIVNVALLGLLVDRAGYDWGPLADVSATVVILVMVWQIVVVARRLKGSLAGQFAVTVPFYLAAAGFLILAILFALLATRVGNYSDLIAAHSRATVWGFAWLTVVGTVVTLLPTLAGSRISATARQSCTRALWVHVGALTVATLLQAAGVSTWAGLAQLVMVLASLMVVQPVMGALFVTGSTWTTAAVSVVAGLLWLPAVAAADAVVLIGGGDPRASTLLLLPAFLGAGLLQLVTGVLHHLLPTLIGGGPRKVTRARAAADRAGGARLTLVNLGALLTLLGVLGPARWAGLILIGIGLVWHVVAISRAVVAQYRSPAPNGEPES
nr:beta-carotene 15,15'-monooxygenase [Corynebacterium guangdongense]